jgi:hypothetical protein
MGYWRYQWQLSCPLELSMPKQLILMSKEISKNKTCTGGKLCSWHEPGLCILWVLVYNMDNEAYAKV